jgi:3-hydroxyacyl-CoA dehydrogenase
MRLLSNLFAVEAIRMAERGEATPQDIDTAMELGAGYRKSRVTPDIRTV